MKVALQVDQLFLNAPGGIGTYIRQLVPALANRDPSVEMTLFHSRFDSSEPPEPWIREHPTHELRGSMRRLYLRSVASTTRREAELSALGRSGDGAGFDRLSRKLYEDLSAGME